MTNDAALIAELDHGELARLEASNAELLSILKRASIFAGYATDDGDNWALGVIRTEGRAALAKARTAGGDDADT